MKARRDRWLEEKILLRSELLWTKFYFERQVELWESRARDSSSPGLTCYAYRQARDWGLLVRQASHSMEVNVITS